MPIFTNNADPSRRPKQVVIEKAPEVKIPKAKAPKSRAPKAKAKKPAASRKTTKTVTEIIEEAGTDAS